MDEQTVGSRLREDIDDLESRDPLQRLTAVRKVRAVIESLEKAAVVQARSAKGRRSWDEIARVMGTTRWSVLRRFGPHGTHPAEDEQLSAVEASGLARLPPESLQPLENLPPELLQKAILLAGELAHSSVRGAHPLSDQPVGMRLQVLPRAIRIELWEGQGRSRAFGEAEVSSPSWIELDLPPGGAQRADARGLTGRDLSPAS
ncbi:MAG TPA: hypothetical protein VGK51_09265 [Actinomycetota bacterium]